MPILPRACIRRGYGPCSDGGRAVPGSSRCKQHGGGPWGRKPADRQAAYSDPQYLANRKAAIEREPACHWRFPGCTLGSTTADHLVSLAGGGTNDLDNLVGACSRCNESRGAAEGRAAMRARARHG